MAGELHLLSRPNWSKPIRDRSIWLMCGNHNSNILRKFIPIFRLLSLNITHTSRYFQASFTLSYQRSMNVVWVIGGSPANYDKDNRLLWFPNGHRTETHKCLFLIRSRPNWNEPTSDRSIWLMCAFSKQW